MATRTIRGEAELGKEDLLAALRDASLRRLGFTLGSACVLVVTASLYFNGLESWPTSTAPIALAAGVFLYLRRLQTQSITQSFSNEFSGEGSTQFVLDAAGFETSNAVRSGQTAWSDFSRYREVRSAFILVKGQAYVVLPKRAFRAEDLPAIRELMRTRIRTKAGPLRDKHLP